MPGLAFEAGYESLSGFNEALSRHVGATGRKAAAKNTVVATRVIDQIAEELDWYFDGQPQQFKTPILGTGTPFQENTWAALREIPYGSTMSYQDLAIAIGRPTAVRAVARANGGNRLAILIPCHRVVGKNGQLTGYGGGLRRKRRLLDLEISNS